MLCSLDDSYRALGYISVMDLIPGIGAGSGKIPPGGGGGLGGHCLFEDGYQKQKYRPPVLCYHSPVSLPLLVYSSLFSRYQRTASCYYCCYSGFPPVDIIFSCPDTITLI